MAAKLKSIGVGMASIVAGLSILLLIGAMHWVNHTYEVLLKIERIEITISQAESSQMLFLITDDRNDLLPLEKTNDEIYDLIDDLKYKVKDNPSQQKNVEYLRQDVELYLVYLNRAVVGSKSGMKDQAIGLIKSGQGIEKFSEVNYLITSMKKEEMKLLKDRYHANSNYLNLLCITIILSIVFSSTAFLKERQDASVSKS